MKRALRKILVLSIVSNFAFATDFPDNLDLALPSYSGIDGPPYADIETELKTLAVQFPKLSSYHSYGSSINGLSLNLIRIANSETVGTQKKAVYIGGSIHGDEYLNIEDRLPRYFLENYATSSKIKEYLDAGNVIYIAPILNPDGYTAKIRENMNGKDLNRDFTVNQIPVTGFSQVETSGLRDFLDADLGNGALKLSVAVDYHCCFGGLLYPWSYSPSPALATGDLERHMIVVDLMQQNLGAEYEHGTTPTLLGYSAPGTSKDHYFEHRGALGFTFEGVYETEKGNLAKHGAWWEDILAKVTTNEI